MNLRPYFALLLFVFLFNTTIAQELKYFEGTFEDLQQQAARKKQPYFIDFYTSWCGYCKKLDQTTFKDPEVIKFIDNNYIPFKSNAEGSEGKALAQKYGVSGFPTMIFFDPDGNVIGKIVGYVDASTFIHKSLAFIKDNKIELRDMSRQEELISTYHTLKTSLDEITYKNLSERDTSLLKKAYRMGASNSRFEYDELLFSSENDPNCQVKELMPIYFALGKGELEKALNRINILFEKDELNPNQLHFFAVKMTLDNEPSISTLRWINSISLQSDDYDLLCSKAFVQLMFGDLKDAKETASKAVKVAKKQKIESKLAELIIQSI